MADNDFDKTVKLPAASTPPTPPSKSDSTAQIVRNDQTVKLTPAQDKIPQPPNPAAPPLPIALDESAPPKKLSPKLLIIPVILLLLLGGAWYFLPPFLKSKATLAGQGSDHAKAAQLLTWATLTYPLNRNAYLLELGREQRLAKDYVNAQKTLENLNAKAPSTAISRELADTYKETGQTQKAYDELQKILTTSPNDADALKSAAPMAFELKNYAQAAVHYEVLGKAGIATAEDYLKLGASYIEQKKAEDAVRAYRAAIEKNPQIKTANAALGKLYAQQEKWEDAMKSYQAELSLSPEKKELAEAFADASINAANVFAAKKKWENAIAILEQGAAVESSQSAEMHYLLATWLAQKKDKTKFLDHLKQAVTQDAKYKKEAQRNRVFSAYRKSAAFQKIVK